MVLVLLGCLLQALRGLYDMFIICCRFYVGCTICLLLVAGSTRAVPYVYCLLQVLRGL
jgi:hypothetical protein